MTISKITVFTCIYIGSAVGVKKKIENLLKKQKEKVERKKRATQRKIEPELIEQYRSNKPEQRAVDMTKDSDKSGKKKDAPDGDQDAEQGEKAEE